MLEGRVYLQFLKEGKYREARDALEEACDKDDAYALWFKATCIQEECLMYDYSKKLVKHLMNKSQALGGCIWALCYKDFYTNVPRDDTDPYWGYYHYVNTNYEDVFLLQHSAERGFAPAQYMLWHETREHTWLEKAAEQRHKHACVELGQCYERRGYLVQSARLYLFGTKDNTVRLQIRRVTAYPDVYNPEYERERLSELCIYGEFIANTKYKPGWWLGNLDVAAAEIMFKTCQQRLSQSLVAWFIVCKRFFVSKDMRILVAKLVIESKYDPYVYGYRLSKDGKPYLQQEQKKQSKRLKIIRRA